MTFFRSVSGLTSAALALIAASAGAQVPVLQPEARLVPSGSQSGDDVGRSVAVAGNWMFASAPDAAADGAVYVFARSGSGWTEQATLTPAVPASRSFGFDLAVAGNTLVVGAPGKWPESGAAYVFVRNGTNWTEQAVWTGSKYFGWSVAISKDTVVVGEPNGAQIGVMVSGPGTAHTFARQGSAWTPQGQLPDPAAWIWGDYGVEVAVSGDTAMIAELTESTGIAGAGEVQVFTRAGASWAHDAVIALTGFSNPPAFGRKIALEGDTAAIGAGGIQWYGFAPGEVHVFDLIGGVWTKGAKLRPAAAGPDDGFPTALALSGDHLVASSAFDGGWAGYNNEPGRAHLFSRQTGVWTETATLRPAQSSNLDTFGWSVDVEDDTVVAGAPFEDGIGAAHVFRLCTEVSSYCTAGLSASGCQAVLAATGTPSASASSGFSLEATGVEGNRDGLFFFGANGRQGNSWGNGTSYQCVVPPVRRAGVLAGSGANGACDGAFDQDLNTHWAANPSKNPGAGAVAQAQLWYRDPHNTSNRTTSLSDAIEFCVVP